MQLFSTLSLAFFAASAVAHNGHAHLHRRQAYGPVLNSTSSVVVATTSSSVAAGGRSSSSTVPYLSTGSSAPVSPSSSKLAPGTGSSSVKAISTGYSAPLTTAPATTPVSTGLSPGETVVTEVSNATLTYTLGTGSSTTVVTTTIQRTNTRTVVKTLYATRASGQDTTVEATSVSTAVVTIPFPSSGTPGVYAEGQGESCVANTVTVTSRETIYVTASPAPSSSLLPVQASSSVGVLSVAPYGNGTVSTRPHGPTASSGFLTHSKSLRPTATGAHY